MLGLSIIKKDGASVGRVRRPRLMLEVRFHHRKRGNKKFFFKNAKDIASVKLVTVEFFLNNEKHKTPRKNFMGNGFDCRNALLIP